MTTKDWILLIVPTAISIASFLTAYLTYSKDTARLKIRANFSASLSENPSMSIEISNIGKRPTTITEAGFRPNHQTMISITSKTGSKIETPAIADIKLAEDYITIPPGEAKKFKIVINRWPSPLIHADTELIAYAKDVTDSYHYGNRGQFLRFIHNSNLNSGIEISDIPPKVLDSSRYIPIPLTRELLYPNKFSFTRSFKRLLQNIKRLLLG